MEKQDHLIDSISLIEGEIHELMRRLVQTDPDAILRLEKLLQRVRIERCVEFPRH